jgi:opacity protein-like surface antigen
MPKALYLLAAAFLLLSVSSAAQVAPAGQQPGAGLNWWIGASVSTFNPDYGCPDGSPFSCGAHQIIGVGPYLDTNFFLLGKIGFEGEIRFMLWHAPGTLNENSYLGGPRVRLFHRGNLNFAGKYLVGVGQLDVPGHDIGSGTYFAFAPGAAIDYRVARNVAARVEYEYQRWPSYPVFMGGSGGLTPNGFSFGVSYKISSSHSE